MIGGVVLVLLTIMTCISIVGRAGLTIGLRPVKGDFELIEAGVAFAIFAFLPWCQFTRSPRHGRPLHLGFAAARQPV